MNNNENFKYELSGNELRLTEYAAKNAPALTEITVPSEHTGIPVTEIGFEAFARSPFLRTIVIPESIHKLGGGAFRECTALESIRIHGNIRQLPAAVFLGCTALKSAELCEGVEVIGSNAFRKCTSLESIALPKTLRSIESCAFLESPKLPAETVMMGLAGSTDHTKPFKHYAEFDWDNALRDDVFLSALKYNSFRDIDTDKLLEEITRRGLGHYLELIEQSGLLMDEVRLDEYVSVSAQKGQTELTAWLLDYKKRRFGFKGGSAFEL